MFQSKVHDQKLELMRAVFRNMYLKEKYEYLDSECKMLAERVVSSQVTNATNCENVSILKTELNSLRQMQNEKERELIETEKTIQSLSLILEDTKSTALRSLHKHKSINEEVSLRDDMIKCLQEELVEVRLAQAEQWALIRELQEIKNGLERDKNAIVSQKPETVSKLQDRIMATNQAVIRYASEFNNIKKQLAQMKTNNIDEPDLVLFQENDESGKGKKARESVKLTTRGAEWKRKGREEIKEVLLKIEQMEFEKADLKERISDLQKSLEKINLHLRLKEEEMNDLGEKLTKAKMKERQMEKNMAERQKKYSHLQETVMEKVSAIEVNSYEKNQNIEDLSNTLNTLASRRQSVISTKLEAKEKDTIEALEEQILMLQEKINSLNSNIFEF